MKNQVQITEMFNKIAPSYDFLNRIFSFGCDKIWRKKAISFLKDIQNPVFLDVATGTGAMVFEMLKLYPTDVYAVDTSVQMITRLKLRAKRKGLEEKIHASLGDVNELNFDNKSEIFDAVTVAFGVRNFQNLLTGLKEICRVTKPGGKIIILELTMPTNPRFLKFYNFYMSKIVIFWGGLISGNKTAYKYLFESIRNFPAGVEFEKILSDAGLNPIKHIRMTYGIATIYVAEKPLQY